MTRAASDGPSARRQAQLARVLETEPQGNGAGQRGCAMDSPYWINDAHNVWMECWEVKKDDFTIVTVQSLREAEKVLWELNQLWYRNVRQWS